MNLGKKKEAHPRRLKILQMLTDGHPYKRICKEVGVTDRRINTLVYELRKLNGCETTIELCLMAYVDGLTTFTHRKGKELARKRIEIPVRIPKRYKGSGYSGTYRKMIKSAVLGGG